MTEQERIKAVMAKMPVLSDKRIQKINSWSFEVRSGFDILREVAEAQRRILAEDGWVKLPSREELEARMIEMAGHLATSGFDIEILHSWLQGDK